MASRKRIFLDANILVAMGFRPKGQYRSLLDVQDLHFVTSEHILSEVTENLSDLGVDPLPFIRLLREHMEVTDQVMKLPAGLPLDDDEDRQALAEAIGARCEEFVTFDSGDFSAIFGQVIYGVFIRHSAEFRRLYLPSNKG